MAIHKLICNLSFIFLFISFLLHSGTSEIRLNYYSLTCPNAEEIVKEQVVSLYNEQGNTAVSWLRTLFHDCIVKSCDASILLESTNEIQSEMISSRNFGMRNFNYINTIKDALETSCPMTVSCADIIALSARDGVVLLGGPYIEMKTGRKDSKKSHLEEIDALLPNHNDSMMYVLSRFQSLGIDVEGTVALLGAHSIGRVHCLNILDRLYPTVDPTLDPDYAEYLKGRCPYPDPDLTTVEYARNDQESPMTLDNTYYKNIIDNKGLLMVDQQLLSNPFTSPYVTKMAADNGYFLEQFSKALLTLSENNPLSEDDGEIRTDCRFVNSE